MKIRFVSWQTLEFWLGIMNTLGIITWIVEAIGRLWVGVNTNVKLELAVTMGLFDVIEFKEIFPAIG